MKINLQGKKYLITSGCSFTDGFNMRERGSWAYYLSDLLNLKLRNKARGGSGNEYISDSIIIELMNFPEIINECVVGIAWSDISRLMTPIYENKLNLLDTIQPHDFLDHNLNKPKHINSKDAQKFFSDIPFCVYKTYMVITKLNHFLDSYNIPYFYVDAINPTQIKNVDNYKFILYGHANSQMEFYFDQWPHQYLYVLNDMFNKSIFKNFLKIGEHSSILDFMFTDYEKYEKGNPGHPNDIASKEVAKIIYNQII
jgi:hypothetical protein